LTRSDKPAVPDAAEILRSVGEAAYEWRLDSDALAWSDNAAAVLGLADTAAIASGRAFAACVEAEAGQSRADVVAAEPPAPPAAAGVAYQVQYAFKRDGGKVWLEDSGRWFAGAGGKPQRAIGVIRAIDARHERDRQLTQLAKFDPLTGEMNRAFLTETLTATLDETLRSRGACGFLLIAIDHLGALNEAYGFEVTEEVIAKVAKRIRPRLRGKDFLGRFSGNKFGVILTRCAGDELSIAAERLLAGVRDDTILTTAGPVAANLRSSTMC